jgi:hypothetical protein
VEGRPTGLPALVSVTADRAGRHVPGERPVHYWSARRLRVLVPVPRSGSTFGAPVEVRIALEKRKREVSDTRHFPPVFAWTWRGSNPRPSGCHIPCYDHSCVPAYGCRLDRSSASRLRPVFPGFQESFLPVSGLSRRLPPLLLPGCGDLAPCGITAHDDSRSPD